MKETVEFSIPKAVPSAAITLVPKVALSRLFLVFFVFFLVSFFRAFLCGGLLYILLGFFLLCRVCFLGIAFLACFFLNGRSTLFRFVLTFS